MIEPVVDVTSHAKALRKIEQLWDAKPGSREERELDAIATLVDVYERRVSPIKALDPLEAIALRCEQLGWTRRELEPLIGSRARVSEVLSSRRPLTLAMIRRLHEALSIPAEVLIADHPKSRSAASRKRPRARTKGQTTPKRAAQRSATSDKATRARLSTRG